MSMAHSDPRNRLMRYQLVPVLSVFVAGLWAGACWWQARRVERVNAARVFAMAYGGSALQELDDRAGSDDPDDTFEDEPMPSGPIRSPLIPGLQFAPAALSPDETRAIRQLQQQIGYTEVVVLVWKRAMFGVAGLLGLVGLIGILTSWVRGPHLFAAVIMLAGMAATLVGMRLLQSPDGGGLPPLSVWSHVIVAAGMSVYPAMLIVLFVRKPKVNGPSQPVPHRPSAV
jgi:hypothetical protein